MTVKYCKCGCGKEIIIKPHHKYQGIPNYLDGHRGPDKKKGKTYEEVYGVKRAIEIKKKISDNHARLTPKYAFKKGCIGWNKGKKMSQEYKDNCRLRTLGHKLSDASRIKSSLTHSGKTKFEGFQSSINKRLRNSTHFKKWREKVFERDNYTCQNKNCNFCNNKKGGNLHPHHIKSFAKYPEDRFDSNNGITYCKEYHMGVVHSG